MRIDKYITLLILTLTYVSYGFLSVNSKLSDDKKDLREQLIKTKDFYDNLSKVSFDLEYSLYKNYSTQIKYQGMSGFYRKSLNNYHSSVLGIITIQNDDAKMVIDTTSRTIIVQDVDSSLDINLLNLSLDEVISKVTSIKKWEVGDIKAFKMDFAAAYNNFSAITFFVNKDNSLHKLVLYFSSLQDIEGKREKPRVEIYYRNIDKKPKFSRQEFKFSEFVTESSGKYTLTNNYKGFSLYNQKQSTF